MNPQSNKRLNWDLNFSFPCQNNTREETSNSFCNELRNSQSLDGAHSKKDNASWHDLTNCRSHIECQIFRGIHPLSNGHHNAWIFVFPCTDPLCSIKFCIIDIHGWCCWHISHNNANLRAINSFPNPILSHH